MAVTRLDHSVTPVGARYGSFTVVASGGRKNRRAMWLCRCDCGHERRRSAAAVAHGHITKCTTCSAQQNGAKRKVNTDRDTLIVDLFADGKSFTRIAKELRISSGAVAGAIWRARQKGLLQGRTKIGAAA